MTTTHLATGLLLGAALLLTAAGLVGLLLGLFFAPWLHAQLPPVLIDAAAVGGAATAIGVVLLGLAAAHLAAALGQISRHRRPCGRRLWCCAWRWRC